MVDFAFAMPVPFVVRERMRRCPALIWLEASSAAGSN